jgi:hypothetical protein
MVRIGSRPAYRGLPLAGPLHDMQQSNRSRISRLSGVLTYSLGITAIALMISAAPRWLAFGPATPSAAHLPAVSFAAVSVTPFGRSHPDPKLQLGFPRCRLHRDGARHRDMVAVVDHSFDVPYEELPLRVKVRARLEPLSRAGAELPYARVHKSPHAGESATPRRARPSRG